MLRVPFGFLKKKKPAQWLALVDIGAATIWTENKKPAEAGFMGGAMFKRFLEWKRGKYVQSSLDDALQGRNGYFDPPLIVRLARAIFQAIARNWQFLVMAAIGIAGVVATFLTIKN